MQWFLHTAHLLTSSALPLSMFSALPLSMFVKRNCWKHPTPFSSTAQRAALLLWPPLRMQFWRAPSKAFSQTLLCLWLCSLPSSLTLTLIMSCYSPLLWTGRRQLNSMPHKIVFLSSIPSFSFSLSFSRTPGAHSPTLEYNEPLFFHVEMFFHWFESRSLRDPWNLVPHFQF